MDYSDQTIELRIKGFTPETMPMAKLAEYMAAFAELVGHPESVRFVKVVRGSVALRAQVREEEASAVLVRLANASSPDSPEDVIRAYRKVDDMLRRDRTEGAVRRGTGRAGTIINFPGARRPEPQVVDIHQAGAVDGRIIRMGGKDSTIPVHVIDDRDEEVKCDAPVALARELRKFLFEDIWLRLHGEGRWSRGTDQVWSVASFRIQSFEVLDETPLTSIVDRLRRIKSGWSNEEDPIGAAMALRGVSGGANRA